MKLIYFLRSIRHISGSQSHVAIVSTSGSAEREHLDPAGSCWTSLLATVHVVILPHLLFHRDGRILAAGGKSNHLHLWCLDAKQLFRIIQMPTKVRAIRHLEFLPDSFDAGSNQVSNIKVGHYTISELFALVP